MGFGFRLFPIAKSGGADEFSFQKFIHVDCESKTIFFKILQFNKYILRLLPFLELS